MNMIEKVARAIGDGWVFEESLCKCFDCINTRAIEKEITINKAKAAIEAMREPTDLQRNEYFRMKKASGCSERDSVFMDAEWERMIDAALTQH